MIHRVTYHNFKGLRDVTVDLAPLTVFVGPNASGKTSFLEGLKLLVRGARCKLLRNVFIEGQNPKHFTTFGTSAETGIAGTTDQGEIKLGWRVERHPKAREPWAPGFERSRVLRRPDWTGTVAVSKNQALKNDPKLLGSSILLRLNPLRLVAASYVEKAIPEMAGDGENLASVLAYVAANQPDVFQEILKGLRKVVSVVQGLQFRKTQVVRQETKVITVDGKRFTHREEVQYWGDAIEFDVVGASNMPARMASEGTMIALAVLTAIIGPNQPHLVLLDDIDRALHPRAQADLVGVLRKLMTQNPNLQIVATSHSPYLLDCLRPEEVRLTTLRHDGSVACARLDEHPEFEKWKNEMAPGEFWSMVGEDWVAQMATAESKQ